MDHAYWGPEYDTGAVDKAVVARRADLDEAHCVLHRVKDELDEADREVLLAPVIGLDS